MEVDVMLFPDLLRKFFSELLGQLFFHNLPQSPVATHERGGIVTRDPLWLSASRDESFQGIDPGSNLEIGAGLQMDGSASAAGEQKTPGFPPPLQHEGAKEIHASMAPDKCPWS
jgi:hypothetical protein